MARAARTALPLLPLLPAELLPILTVGETVLSFCLFECELLYLHLEQVIFLPLKFLLQQKYCWQVLQSTRLNSFGLHMYKGATTVVGKLLESAWKRSKPALSHLSSWIISRRRRGSSLALKKTAASASESRHSCRRCTSAWLEMRYT